MHTREDSPKGISTLRQLQTLVLAIAFVGLLALGGFYLAAFIYQHTPVLQHAPSTQAAILKTVLPIDEINSPKRTPPTQDSSPPKADNPLPFKLLSPRNFVTTLPSLDDSIDDAISDNPLKPAIPTSRGQ